MVRLAFNRRPRSSKVAPRRFRRRASPAPRGLPKEVVGLIHLLPQQSLVDVAQEHEEEIREKLTGIRFKGRKLFVELAAGDRR